MGFEENYFGYGAVSFLLQTVARRPPFSPDEDAKVERQNWTQGAMGDVWTTKTFRVKQRWE